MAITCSCHNGSSPGLDSSRLTVCLISIKRQTCQSKIPDRSSCATPKAVKKSDAKSLVTSHLMNLTVRDGLEQ